MVSGDDKKDTLNSFEIGLAGASTGTITRFLVQPLDVLKIHFQLQVTPTKNKELSKYSSLSQAIRRIVAEEGVFGLWKGHLPAQYLSIVYGSIQFSSYEALIFYANKTFTNKKLSPHLINITCGGLAGVAAVIISFPFDVLKTHMVFQGTPKIYKGTIDAVSQIYRREGLHGFTRGVGPACLQNAPMSGLVFYFHGLFAQFWSVFFNQVDSTKSEYLSTSGSLVTGLLAGLCAKTIVYPFDLMKKRLQIQSFDDSKSCTKVMMRCNGFIECLRLIVRHEGVLGLFKGFIPSLLKAGATTSLYFTIYDKTCQFIQFTKRWFSAILGWIFIYFILLVILWITIGAGFERN